MRIKRRHVASRHLGTIIARAMVAGDLETARVLANGRTTWRVSEVRAIIGAALYCERAYGAPKGLAREILGFPADGARVDSSAEVSP